LHIELDSGDGSPKIEIVQADYKAPARNAEDILPPEIRQRWMLPPHLKGLK